MLSLSFQDRQDVATSTDYADRVGYDRLTIHHLGRWNGLEICDIVFAHRYGEAWASWVFARTGDMIQAWSALTGADAGSFPAMATALRAVLQSGNGHATIDDTPNPAG